MGTYAAWAKALSNVVDCPDPTAPHQCTSASINKSLFSMPRLNLLSWEGLLRAKWPPQNSLSNREAFVPPKPKELQMAADGMLGSICRASGPTRPFSRAGSALCRLMVGGAILCFNAKMEKIACTKKRKHEQ